MSLILEFDPDLRFELIGFPDPIVGSICRFLPCHVGARDPDPHRPAYAIQCRSGRRSARGSVILEDSPLVVRQQAGLIVLELPGVSCWCRTSDTGEEPPAAEVLLHDLDLVPIEHLTQWVLIAAMFQLAQEGGWIGLHAAAISSGESVMVLPGPSGCGKSTLFHGACQAGLTGISEDLVWLREVSTGFRCVGLRRDRDAGQDHLASSGPGVSIEPPVRALVFPCITRRSKARLSRLTRPHALSELLCQASLLGRGAGMGRRFQRLVRLVGQVRCLRLEAGVDRSSAIELLHQAVAPRGS